MQMTTTFSFADAHEMQIFFSGMAEMLAKTQTAFTQLFAGANVQAQMEVRDSRPLKAAAEGVALRRAAPSFEGSPTPAAPVEAVEQDNVLPPAAAEQGEGQTAAEEPKRTRGRPKKTATTEAPKAAEDAVMLTPETKKAHSESFEIPAGIEGQITEADLQRVGRQIMAKGGKTGGTQPVYKLLSDEYQNRKFAQLTPKEMAECMPKLMKILLGDEIPF